MTHLPRRLILAALAALLALGTLPMTVLAADPIAASDIATTNEDTAVTITVTATDDDGDALSFATGSGPAHGGLGAFTGLDCSLPDPLACSAQVEYTPDANYHGPDSFTFIADDGNGGTGTGTIAITVVSVNDPPVVNEQDDRDQRGHGPHLHRCRLRLHRSERRADQRPSHRSASQRCQEPGR